MNSDLENKVISYLTKNPRSSAKEMAKNLSLNKSELNKFLYAEKNKGNLNSDGTTPPKWWIEGTIVAKVEDEREMNSHITLILLNTLQDSECLSKMLPYLSQDIHTHIIVRRSEEVRCHDFLTRSYVEDTDLSFAAQIQMALFAASFPSLFPTRPIHMIIVDYSETAGYLAKELGKMCKVDHITNGWEGLKMHLE